MCVAAHFGVPTALLNLFLVVLAASLWTPGALGRRGVGFGVGLLGLVSVLLTALWYFSVVPGAVGSGAVGSEAVGH